MSTTDPTHQPGRRTKRRYAHELYPHPADDGTTQPLEEAVPYLYARAQGLEVNDTGWFDAPLKESMDRTHHLIAARQIAFLADALHQGLTGQEGWEWADQRAGEESGEWVWERAVHYGVNPDQIKPYPCGPEPDRHEHVGPQEIGGRVVQNIVTMVDGPEDACDDCTEPVESAAVTS